MLIPLIFLQTIIFWQYIVFQSVSDLEITCTKALGEKKRQP